LTKNDYQYLKPIVSRGKTLTPMDEWLYSERNISEGKMSFGEFQNYGDVFENTANDRFFNAEGGITEVITKYPVLVNPSKGEKDTFRLDESNKQLPGNVQTTRVDGLTIKGTTPVFQDNDELTVNDFEFLEPVVAGGKTLTPMDEWLYSERNISEGNISFGEFQNYGDVFENSTKDKYFNANGVAGPLTEEEAKRQGESILSGQMPSTQTTYLEFLEKQAKEKGTAPNTQAQLDAAKQTGKFWDNTSKSWKKFKDSPAGQFALQQTLAYLQQKAAGGQTNVTVPPPPPDATESNNTIWYVVGGVAIIGILALVITRSNKTA